jgi:excisionase family DNA binding protein
MKEQLENLLTVSEVADYLRLSKSQVYAMISQRKLPCIRLSERRVVVSEKDLLVWVRKQKGVEPSQLVFMIDNLLEEREGKA